MKKTRLQNINETILHELKRKKLVREEQVYIYFDGIVDALENGNRISVSNEEQDLSDYLNEVWAYRNLDDFSRETSFLLGSVWGAMKVEAGKRERRKEISDIETLVKKYHNYFWFLHTMEQTPGINHKELAKRGKKTPSELSQFISRVEPDRLFSYNRVGREKYYYLQERGRRVYTAVKKEKRADTKKLSVSNDTGKLYSINSKVFHERNSSLSAPVFLQKEFDFRKIERIRGMGENIGNEIEVFRREEYMPLRLENAMYELRLEIKACLAAASNVNSIYNPVSIYGDKTMAVR